MSKFFNEFQISPTPIIMEKFEREKERVKERQREFDRKRAVKLEEKARRAKEKRVSLGLGDPQTKKIRAVFNRKMAARFERKPCKKAPDLILKSGANVSSLEEGRCPVDRRHLKERGSHMGLKKKRVMTVMDGVDSRAMAKYYKLINDK